MIVFLGLTESKEFVRELKKRRIGRLQVRGHMRLGVIYQGERWAYDNGAFSDWKKGNEFDSEQFHSDLDTIVQSNTAPVFSVLPDLPTRGEESLSFSLKWLEALSDSFNWYLAVQNGMTYKSVEVILNLIVGLKIRGLFIGGDDDFKRTARDWADLAHSNGKWCHYARASTPKKMAFAYECGCDSIDTTQPLWEKGKFWRFLRFFDNHFETAQTSFDFE